MYTLEIILSNDSNLTIECISYIIGENWVTFDFKDGSTSHFNVKEVKYVGLKAVD